MSKLSQYMEDHLISPGRLQEMTGLSAPTIQRARAGGRLHIETKRRILEALGIDIKDKEIVFTREVDNGQD